MYEIIYKRLHANNPNAPPYSKPKTKTSFQINSTHIANFAVQENNVPIEPKILTPAFEDLNYSKLVFILNPKNDQKSDTNSIYQSEERIHLQKILKIEEHDESNVSEDVRIIRKQKALLEIDNICNSKITGVTRLVHFNIIDAIVYCIQNENDLLILLLCTRCLSKILRLSFTAREKAYKDRRFFMSIYEVLYSLHKKCESQPDQEIKIPDEYQCSISLKSMKFSKKYDCMRYIIRILSSLAHHVERGAVLQYSRNEGLDIVLSDEDEETYVNKGDSPTPDFPSIIQYLIENILEKQKDAVVLIEALDCIHAYVSTHATARSECLSFDIMKVLKSFLTESQSSESDRFQFRYGPNDIHDDDLVNHPRLPNNESEISPNRPFLSAAPYTLISLISHTCSCIAVLSFESSGAKEAIAAGCIPDLIYWMNFSSISVKDAACEALMYLTLDIQGKRISNQYDIVEKVNQLVVNNSERSSTKLFVLSIINAMSHLPEAKKKLKPLASQLQNLRSTTNDAPHLRKKLDESFQQAYQSITHTV